MLINMTEITAKQMEIVNGLIKHFDGRTTLTRSELISGHHAVNPNVISSPQWISKNEAAHKKDEKGNRLRGFFDLTVFTLKPQVVTVAAPAEVKPIDATIDATADMAKTVEAEQLMTDVVASTEAPAIVAEVPAEAKKKRKSKREAKKAAEVAATTTEEIPSEVSAEVPTVESESVAS